MFPSELYRAALEKEFALSYSKMGSVQSWQSMPVGERDWHFDKLVEVRTEEKDRMKEEQAKLAQARGRKR